MFNKIAVVIFFSAFVLGCTTIKHKVFNGIDYAVEAPKGYVKITSIEIRKKGNITTLEELLPALKESVSGMNFVRNVIITNVIVTPFPKNKKRLKNVGRCDTVTGKGNGSLTGYDVDGKIRSDRVNSRSNSYVTCSRKLVKVNSWSEHFQITADVFAYPKIIPL